MNLETAALAVATTSTIYMVVLVLRLRNTDRALDRLISSHNRLGGVVDNLCNTLPPKEELIRMIDKLDKL